MVALPRFARPDDVSSVAATAAVPASATLGRVVALSSGRGGTGLSTLVAGLALDLARRGHLVLSVDLSAGLGDLHRLEGIVRTGAFCVGDVVARRVELLRAVTVHPTLPNLSHLTAGSGGAEPLRAIDVVTVVSDAVGFFDVVLLDVPRGWSPLAHASVLLAQDVLLLGAGDVAGTRSTADVAALFRDTTLARLGFVSGWRGSGAVPDGFSSVAAVPDLSVELTAYRRLPDGVPSGGRPWREAFSPVAAWVEAALFRPGAR